MRYPYGLVCVIGTGVHHFCGFEKEPSVADVMHLIEELATDEEFNMTHMKCGVDFYIAAATEQELDKIAKLLEEQNENLVMREDVPRTLN